MKRGLLTCFAMALVLVSAIAADKGEKKVTGPLGFTMKGIDGKDVDLAKYKGKVVLIVNVASRCGLTPQYSALQAVYEKNSAAGLVVLGVPANEFGAQEPGTDNEIKEFCSENYKVTFPMLSKVVVKGSGICPLYKYLTSKETNGELAGDITWNFEKFLIGRDGKVVARFKPSVAPDSEQVTKAIAAELAKK